MKHVFSKHTASWLGVAVLTAFCIYLTPLRNVALVEPSIWDVDPTWFAQELQQHPDKFDFIDVRPTSEFNAGHAPGSRNIPLHMLFDEWRNLPKTGKIIVLVCSGGRASGVGYGYLQHEGFLNVRRIEGGLQNWTAEGLSLEGDSVVK